MKKVFIFLFSSLLLCSCRCLLSQIPPQYIYAGSGCTAPIPDYKSQVNVTGGCTGFTLTQTPVSGTLLTATNKTATVIMKATGTNGKSSQIQFTVSMLDTITPKITPTGTLVSYKINQANDIYSAGDKVIASITRLSKDALPFASFLPADSFYDETMRDILIVMSHGDNRIIARSDSAHMTMFVNKRIN